MGVNASRGRHTPDYDASVVLRDINGAAVTTTTSETGKSLRELDAAYWHGGEIPHGVFPVQVDVKAMNIAGTNAYAISLQVDDVAAMNDTPVEIAKYTIPGPGSYTFYVDSKVIPKLDAESSGDDKFLGVKATVSGDTTPSISYGAFIGPKAQN